MTDNNNNDYLTRLFDYMRLTTPKAILEAERAMLVEEIKNITAERDAAVASTVAAFEPELKFRRERLSVIDGKIAGEQMGLFSVGPITDKIEIKCGTDFDATNTHQRFNDKLTEILNAGLTKDAFVNVQTSPDYGNNKPVLLFSDTVIPCSIDNKDTGNEPESYFNTPKNAQVVTRDGQTFFVFKSAGYKAIAERLGFLYRPMLDGSKGYMLTPKEYDEVFTANQRQKNERTWRVIGGRPLEIDG